MDEVLRSPSILTRSGGPTEIDLRGRKAMVDLGPQLTAEGYGVAFDMGFLVARCLLMACPDLEWAIGGRPRNSISYNKPILTFRGEQPPARDVFDPILVSISKTYSLARGDRAEGRTEPTDGWRESYDAVRDELCGSVNLTGPERSRP